MRIKEGVNQYILADGVSEASRRLMHIVSERASDIVAAHHTESGDVHVPGDRVGYDARMTYSPASVRAQHSLGRWGRLTGYAPPKRFLPDSLNLKMWNEERYSVQQRPTADGPVYDVSRRYWGVVEHVEYNPRTHWCTAPDVTHNSIEL